MQDSVTTTPRLTPTLRFVGDTVLLFGYRLTLSPTERALLKMIYRRSPDNTAAEDACALGISPDSLPVLVSSINKKASALEIGRLIESERSAGYRMAFRKTPNQRPEGVQK